MSSGGGGGVDAGDPRKPDEPESAAQIEGEIEAVRRQMSDVAGELHRRGARVAAFTRRWSRRLAPAVGGLVVLAAAGLTYRYWRARRRARAARWWAALRSRRPGEALDELRARVSRAVAPTRARRSHRLRDAGLKIGTAALGAAASMAGKQLARRLVSPERSPRS